jgi:hypothetical protein
VLDDVGQTITVRIEVNNSTIVSDALMFIYYAVAGLSAREYSSGSISVVIRERADTQTFSSAPSTGASHPRGTPGQSSQLSWPGSSRRSQRYYRAFHWVESHADRSQRQHPLPTATQNQLTWQLGPTNIRYQDLRIASLDQVSPGSWQIRLFHKP